MWPSIAQAKTQVVVVGLSDEVAAGLLAQHPEAQIIVPPFIAPTKEALRPLALEVMHAALLSEVQFIILGLGFPKDPIIAAILREEWPSDTRPPYVLCFGASAELYLGIRKRAPRWMRNIGLEWMHRFAQEPRRMLHRYFVRDPAFLKLAFRELVSQRTAPK